MLKVIQNRISTKAEELAAEQAGFRPGGSTGEQINCRFLIEKRLQHQRDIYHNFIDFKKLLAVWDEGLWKIEHRRVSSTSSSTTSAVLLSPPWLVDLVNCCACSRAPTNDPYQSRNEWLSDQSSLAHKRYQRQWWHPEWQTNKNDR